MKKMDLDIYMEQPEGFPQGNPKELVFLLDKALYGEQQGGRQWNTRMHEVLTELGLIWTHSDTSLYIHAQADLQIMIPVFVDDMTLASKAQPAIEHFITELSKHFKLCDLGPTTQLLGMKVDRDCSQCSLFLS